MFLDRMATSYEGRGPVRCLVVRGLVEMSAPRAQHLNLGFFSSTSNHIQCVCAGPHTSPHQVSLTFRASPPTLIASLPFAPNHAALTQEIGSLSCPCSAHFPAPPLPMPFPRLQKMNTLHILGNGDRGSSSQQLATPTQVCMSNTQCLFGEGE